MAALPEIIPQAVEEVRVHHQAATDTAKIHQKTAGSSKQYETHSVHNQEGGSNSAQQFVQQQAKKRNMAALPETNSEDTTDLSVHHQAAVDTTKDDQFENIIQTSDSYIENQANFMLTWALSM